MKQLTLAMVSLSPTPGQHGGRRFLADCAAAGILRLDPSLRSQTQWPLVDCNGSIESDAPRRIAVTPLYC